MNSRVSAVVVCAFLFAGVASAWGQSKQPAPAAASSDGTKALDRCREALSRVDALSYEARVEGGGGLELPLVEAKVSMARADAGGWKVYAKGTSGGTPFETSFDGAEAHSVREKEKVVYQKTPRDQTDLMVFFSGQQAKHPIAWELIQEVPLAVGKSAPVHQGEATVAGVKCEKVLVPGSGDAAPDADHGYTVYIATTDVLPRRIDRHVGVAGTQARVLTLNDLRVGRESIGADYSLPVPSGFAVKNPDARERRTRSTWGDGDAGGRRGKLAVGDMAPEFSLKDASGKERTLSGYKGRVVVLDFWATWCGPCRAAMPGIQKIHERFKDQPVTVLGIAFNDNGDPVEYMKSKKYTYGLLLGGEVLAESYGVSGIPHFFVIGKDGKVLLSQVGYGPGQDERLIEVIEEALKEGE